MKLSDYAKQQGVRYETAWRWFRDGKIRGRRVGAHTILIEEAVPKPGPVAQVTAVYTRVSSAENTSNLDSQAERLVAYCTVRGYQVSKVVKEIGYNQEWKQEVNIGKRNNQIFVNIPFARFIHMLTYKAELVGIQVRMTEESYTSKCSFLDSEPIGKHDVYAGKRNKPRLFRSADGHCYNADVNGSYVRRFGAYQISPKGDEVEGNQPQGHPTYLMRKLKGENSMLGKRLNGKVCTMTRRKSCTHGEA